MASTYHQRHLTFPATNPRLTEIGSGEEPAARSGLGGRLLDGRGWSAQGADAAQRPDDGEGSSYDFLDGDEPLTRFTLVESAIG